MDSLWPTALGGTHRGPKAVEHDFFKKMMTYYRWDGFDTPVVMAGETSGWVFTPVATWTATRKDANGSVAPGSAQIVVPMCLVMEVQDDKIVRYLNYCDTGEIERSLAKLGAVK
ncbi:hypothetical protein WJX73_006631 [Symbiochloris irregularis]|uniref:SnoaL-like domain-containing protein n=1 Tax=Symbiochloris irregularis TaxID=706552 RepID=A0AAW1NPI6_9CHLO